MADIIDTLHPKSATANNLYPKIKPDCIDDGALPKTKLATHVYSHSVRLYTSAHFDITLNFYDPNPDAFTSLKDLVVYFLTTYGTFDFVCGGDFLTYGAVRMRTTSATSVTFGYINGLYTEQTYTGLTEPQCTDSVWQVI